MDNASLREGERIPPHSPGDAWCFITRALVSALFLVGSVRADDCGDGKDLSASAERLVTELGDFSAPTEEYLISSLGHTGKIFGGSKTRYLRGHLQIVQPGDSNWYIAVRDNHERLVETLVPDDFRPERADGPPVAWTKRHYIDVVEPVLSFRMIETARSEELATVRIVHQMRMWEADDMDRTPFYSSADPKNPRYWPLYCVKNECQIGNAVRHLGENVAFLVIHKSVPGELTRVHSCSGLVLPPRYVITNWHCGYDGNDSVWNEDTCLRTLVDLSWDDDAASRDMQCHHVVDADPVLDIAVLELKGLKAEAVPIPPVTFVNTACSVSPDGSEDCATREAIARQENWKHLRAVHHPRGAQKSVTYDCELNNTAVINPRSNQVTDFAHRCDTFPGSSGAPIIDDKGRIVGIHHLGYELVKDRNGKCVAAPEGTNKAVWIDRVAAYLDGLNAAGKAHIEYRISDW